MNKCDLCSDPIYPVIWKNNKFRLVEIDDPSYSAYYRVENIQHVKEMTDLEEKDRMELMQVVFTVESAIRTCYKPDKINLASLGNLTIVSAKTLLDHNKPRTTIPKSFFINILNF